MSDNKFTETVNVRVTKSMKEKLTKEAERKGKKPGAYMRELAEQGLYNMPIPASQEQQSEMISNLEALNNKLDILTELLSNSDNVNPIPKLEGSSQIEAALIEEPSSSNGGFFERIKNWFVGEDKASNL